MTNGDKIRQMSNEELKDFLIEDYYMYARCKVCKYQDGCGTTISECEEGIKAYLESEVE